MKLLKGCLTFIADIVVGMFAYFICLTIAIIISISLEDISGMNLELPATIIIGMLSSYLFWETKRVGEGLLSMSFFIIIQKTIETFIGTNFEFIYKLLLEIAVFIPIYILIIMPIKRFLDNFYESKSLDKKSISARSLNYKIQS